MAKKYEGKNWKNDLTEWFGRVFTWDLFSKFFHSKFVPPNFLLQTIASLNFSLAVFIGRVWPVPETHTFDPKGRWSQGFHFANRAIFVVLLGLRVSGQGSAGTPTQMNRSLPNGWMDGLKMIFWGNEHDGMIGRIWPSEPKGCPLAGGKPASGASSSPSRGT